MIHVSLRNAAETQLVEGQYLEEQLNMLKLRMFRVRANYFENRGATFSDTETFIKNKASK
jgi:hypothetical protein